MLPPWNGRNSWSSTELVPYWNYAIGKDFQRDGVTATYAPGHPHTWDKYEVDKIVFEQRVPSLSINSTHELLAFAVGNDIHVYKTADRNRVQVLKGHTVPVSGVAWSPTDPQFLVSSAADLHARNQAPQIVIWNTAEYGGHEGLDESTITDLARKAIINLDKDILDLEPKSGWTLTSTDRDSLTTTLDAALSKHYMEYLIRDCTRLEGDLETQRDGGPFSPDGKSLLFLPYCPSFRPNGNSPRPIDVFDMELKQVRCTLHGHIDSIMWAGFSPDSSLVGTACWDGTFRIWDAKSGTSRYVFEVKNRPQNWTAGFSPDGKLFAGTDGKGQIHIYDLGKGTEMASFNFADKGRLWCRTLDWSPDSKYLAVSGLNLARVMVIEPLSGENGLVIQDRQLSTEACEEGVRHIMTGFLETTLIKFLSDGRLVFKVAGDRGLEVYDFEKNEKMRFAAPHSEDPQSTCWGPFVYCPREGLLVSVDDGPLKNNGWDIKTSVVRFWKV